MYIDTNLVCIGLCSGSFLFSFCIYGVVWTACRRKAWLAMSRDSREEYYPEDHDEVIHVLKTMFPDDSEAWVREVTDLALNESISRVVVPVNQNSGDYNEPGDSGDGDGWGHKII